MKFEEVLSTVKSGKKIRLNYWEPGEYLHYKNGRLLTNKGIRCSYMFIKIFAENWETVPEPEPVGMITDDSAIVAPETKR